MGSTQRKITCSVKTVTPELARQFLSTNRKNRRLVARRVERLATAITNGEWVLSQPLMFNCDGTLIDGQHRCHAVIKANKPTSFVVLHGFDPVQTFAKIDDVAERKLSHWLDIQGETHPDTLAVVIRLSYYASLGRIPFYNPGQGVVLTGPMGIEFLEEHPELRDAVNKAPGIHNLYVPVSMCAYLYSIFITKDKFKANHFFVELIADDYAGKGDPIYLLRSRMKLNKTAKTKLTRPEMAALVIKAWNAYQKDEKVSQLKWNSVGPMAEPFPKIQ